MPEKVYYKFRDSPGATDVNRNRTSDGAVIQNRNFSSIQGQKRKREGTSSQTSSSGQGWRPLPKNQTTQGPGSTARSDARIQGRLKERAKALYPIRKTLPIWSHIDAIRAGLRSKNVMLLVGETGSGKSTQVPQFLISEQWCKTQKVKVVAEDKGSAQEVSVGGCIAITEPRRVAAISLARRVAEEMGTPLGSCSPASKVGYSVRFDNSTSPSTRIKFLTEGMLLQEMLRDPWLRQYSAVIVDEVHERGVNVDLIMGFLRGMLSGKNEGRGGIPLKVAVMSATADMVGLLKFFESDFEGLKSKASGRINGHAGHVPEPSASTTDQQDTDGESEWSGISSDSDEEHPPPREQHKVPNGISKFKHATNGTVNGGPRNDFTSGSGKQNGPETLKSDQVSLCYIEGRQYPVQILHTDEPVQDFVDAALRTIFQIHYKEPLPGDVLVFLTGQETVETLEKLVREYAQGMGPNVPKVCTYLCQRDSINLSLHSSWCCHFLQLYRKQLSKEYSSPLHRRLERSS